MRLFITLPLPTACFCLLCGRGWRHMYAPSKINTQMSHHCSYTCIPFRLLPTLLERTADHTTAQGYDSHSISHTLSAHILKNSFRSTFIRRERLSLCISTTHSFHNKRLLPVPPDMTHNVPQKYAMLERTTNRLTEQFPRKPDVSGSIEHQR